MLGLGVSILEMMIVPIPSLVIGSVLLFFALKRIKTNSESSELTLEILDYVKGLGCLGFIGAAFFLIGLLLAISSFFGILLSLF